jgi:hypothetical protein
MKAKTLTRCTQVSIAVALAAGMVSTREVDARVREIKNGSEIRRLT